MMPFISNDKYETTGKTFEDDDDRVMHQIRAKRDIGVDVKAGDLGGFIEHEHNLSPEGDCWVYPTAQVFSEARASGNARICSFARVYGSATVTGDAQVCDGTIVYGPAVIAGDATVSLGVINDQWIFGREEA